MTAAARTLRVSQPTLSVAVRQLEAELGASLMQRHRGGVSLTAAGADLLRHVDEIFVLLEQASASIAGLKSDLTGRFVLGCHESLGAYFLPRLLREVLRDAPGVALSLRNAPSHEVLGAVVERQVHFGLVVNPRPHPDLVMTPLFTDAVDFFVLSETGAGPSTCATHDVHVAYDLLKTRPLIFPGRVQQCVRLLELLDERGVVPQQRLSCGDFELVKSLALGGIGVGLLPRRIAAHGTATALRRLHHDLPFVPDTIVLVYRADLPKTRAAGFLKDALAHAAHDMPDIGIPLRGRPEAHHAR